MPNIISVNNSYQWKSPLESRRRTTTLAAVSVLENIYYALIVEPLITYEYWHGTNKATYEYLAVPNAWVTGHNFSLSMPISFIIRRRSVQCNKDRAFAHIAKPRADMISCKGILTWGETWHSTLFVIGKKYVSAVSTTLATQPKRLQLHLIIRENGFKSFLRPMSTT